MNHTKLKKLLLNAELKRDEYQFEEFTAVNLSEKLAQSYYGSSNSGCYNKSCKGEEFKNKGCHNSSCKGSKNTSCKDESCS